MRGERDGSWEWSWSIRRGNFGEWSFEEVEEVKEIKEVKDGAAGAAPFVFRRKESARVQK